MSLSKFQISSLKKLTKINKFKFKPNYNCFPYKYSLQMSRKLSHKNKWSQILLGEKFWKNRVHQKTIGRQLAKMGNPYRKREKTPKYSANQQQRVKGGLSDKLTNNLYRSSVEVVMDDEKYFTFYRATKSLETQDITPVTRANAQIKFALPEKRSIRPRFWSGSPFPLAAYQSPLFAHRSPKPSIPTFTSTSA